LFGSALGPFNIFIDGVVREINARVLERGAALMGDSDDEWQLSQILYVDDTALVADEECKLQILVSKFVRVCERIKIVCECCKEQGYEGNKKRECW
jgi:hypothetical protein